MGIHTQASTRVCLCVHVCAYMCIHIQASTCVYMCARMGVCVHAHSYVCIYRCTCVHVYMCVYVCVCVKGHTIPQLLLSHLHPLSAHTNFTSQSAHAQLLPTLGPPLRPSPTWDQLPPWNTQTVRLRGPEEALAEGNAKLITGRWVCLFAWHAFVSDCFIHPLSQPKSSQFILPAQKDQIGGVYAQPQKPDIDFQLSFNFAPVFICSFHFFQMDWREKKKKL